MLRNPRPLIDEERRQIFSTAQQKDEKGCVASFCSTTSRNAVDSSSWGTKDIPNHQHHVGVGVDLDLVKEMNELSVQEREKVYDEIHGVAKAQEESPEFVTQSIQEMDTALKNLPRTRRKALDRASFLYPGLATDIKFKLMFLRAEYFDPGRSARRMAKHFEDKLMLFGEEKLVKKITWEDLDEEGQTACRSGCCLELPQKDPTGRPIWFFDLSRYQNVKNMDSLLRASWYQVMSTVQDDEIAQQKGVFDITYAPGNVLEMPKKLAMFPELLRRSGDVIVSLPCRVTSYHFCYEDFRLHYLLSIIQKYFGKHLRLRVRTHFGTYHAPEWMTRGNRRN